MAYDITSVSDPASLVTFIRNTCTANGWTLSGNILHKGACYVEIIADGTVGVRIIGGTGKDGSNNLTGAAPFYSYLGTVAGIPLAYPMTVEAHVNASPDEVYFVVNYSVSYYGMIAFGVSDVPGLTGTGCWFHATRSQKQGSREYQSDPGGIGTLINFGSHPDGFPMFSAYGTQSGQSGGSSNSFVHADVDAGGWNAADGASWFPSSNIFISPLLNYLPNAWNSESVLLPFPVYMPRSAGNKVTLVADFKHIRHCRIDFITPGDIVTLGVDKWKMYPWFRKDTTARDGGSSTTHSGTIGFAVRYTGP